MEAISAARRSRRLPLITRTPAQSGEPVEEADAEVASELFRAEAKSSNAKEDVQAKGGGAVSSRSVVLQMELEG